MEGSSPFRNLECIQNATGYEPMPRVDQNWEPGQILNLENLIMKVPVKRVFKLTVKTRY